MRSKGEGRDGQGTKSKGAVERVVVDHFSTFWDNQRLLLGYRASQIPLGVTLAVCTALDSRRESRKLREVLSWFLVRPIEEETLDLRSSPRSRRNVDLGLLHLRRAQEPLLVHPSHALLLALPPKSELEPDLLRSSPSSQQPALSHSSSPSSSGSSPASEDDSNTPRFVQPASFYKSEHTVDADAFSGWIGGSIIGPRPRVWLSPEDDEEAQRGIPIFEPTMEVSSWQN